VLTELSGEVYIIDRKSFHRRAATKKSLKSPTDSATTPLSST
jgi:hypothetical protein